MGIFGSPGGQGGFKGGLDPNQTDMNFNLGIQEAQQYNQAQPNPIAGP